MNSVSAGFVYILRCSNGRYYVGSTNNLERRIGQHLAKKVQATKFVQPITLVFSQSFSTLTFVRRAELALKKKKSRIILNKIIKEGRISLADNL